MLDPARRPQVICIEDDAAVAQTMRESLAPDGIDVETFGTVAEARTRLAAGPPADLVVLDAILPGGSGIDMYREFQATPGWEGVPVLFVTARSDEASVAPACTAGATDYVTRPMDREEFRHRVRRLLQADRERRGLEWFEAPLAADPELASAGPARFRPGTRVLVVDDEDLVRGVLKAMLEKNGCEVLTAANGREGLDVLRRERGRVDAVLLDLNMPVLDGERALDEIKAMNPALPVWIMTGYDRAGREDRLTGIRGVLRKPMSVDTLYRALGTVLGT